MSCTTAHSIADLNDQFRCTFTGGRVMLTCGVRALGEKVVADALQTVRQFSDFPAGNDPYGEHDFGSFEFQGQRLFWKIDYYDHSLTAASPDPGDPAVTTRVLTIMLAEEY